MRLSGWLVLATALTAATAGMAQAADAPAPGGLTDTTPFQHAYAASFYGFDACGEGLTGKVWRSVLEDKFQHCPFTPDAKMRFKQWTRGQREKSTEAIKEMIIAHGGLPVRLEGMAQTCHEHFTSPEDQTLRENLDHYQQGKIDANAILPQPCDAPNFVP